MRGLAGVVLSVINLNKDFFEAIHLRFRNDTGLNPFKEFQVSRRLATSFGDLNGLRLRPARFQAGHVQFCVVEDVRDRQRRRLSKEAWIRMIAQVLFRTRQTRQSITEGMLDNISLIGIRNEPPPLALLVK